MHLESLNLALDSQPSKGDEWEGSMLSSRKCQDDKKAKSVPQEPATNYL
jgi:hypothetical protein